jgi:hypothetical protein
MTAELRELEYKINPKKVYRLMKEAHLLSGKRVNVQGKRNGVKHQRSVRQNDVIALMRWLDLRFGLKGVIIRNDNGSQFIAHKVREVLQSLEAKQEFTHVATPEENAYIEAFHSIEQSELIDRHSFSSFYDAKQHIEKYMHWYNFRRKHGAIGFMTPVKKWEEFYQKTLFTFTLSGEAEADHAGEPACSADRQPVRNNLTNEDDQRGRVQIIPCSSPSSLLTMPSKTQSVSYGVSDEQSVVNLFEKIVQFIGG